MRRSNLIRFAVGLLWVQLFSVVPSAWGKGSDLTLTLRGPGLGLSDHVSFQRRNIPVVEFTTGVHSDLHRTSDTPDKINPSGAIDVLNIVDKLTESLAVRPESIPYDGPK